jgi:hypothetical protein
MTHPLFTIDHMNIHTKNPSFSKQNPGNHSKPHLHFNSLLKQKKDTQPAQNWAKKKPKNDLWDMNLKEKGKLKQNNIKSSILFLLK